MNSTTWRFTRARNSCQARRRWAGLAASGSWLSRMRRRIARQVYDESSTKTTVAVERASLRLMGIKPDDIAKVEIPFAEGGPIVVSRAKKEDTWAADKTPAGQKVKADKIVLVDRESVRQALSRLSATDRAVLVLVDVEGRSMAEAAEALGTTNVGTRLRAVRARRKLAALLRRPEAP